MTIDLSKFYLIEKRSLVKFLFYAGMILSFFASLRPWFLWSIHSYYPVFVSFLLLLAMLIDRTTSRPVFSRTDFLIPVAAYLLLGYYQGIVASQSIKGLISVAFLAFIFFALFRYERKELSALSTILAKSMAILLIPSMFFFFLYLLGFPLPSSNLQYGDAFYLFSNYYFFLIDERQLLAFIPRFQSVFPEPSHLGTVCAVLLLAQRGKWRRWWNITLLTALLISFSLGAYVYLVAIVFLNMWTKGRRILLNLILISAVIASVIIGSFYYNDGDNLVNSLIVLRMEVDEGELAGNNRTTADFDADFENFMQSSDILFGRERQQMFGDSGYKVFIYDNGFVGLALIIVFFFLAFNPSNNRRAKISAWIVTLLIFGVDAFVLWFGRFIPLYCAAYNDLENKENNEDHEPTD